MEEQTGSSGMNDGTSAGPAELVFREDWAETPAARPITQAHVAHPELVLGVHGAGARELKKSHHDEIMGDPYYLWSGKCSGPWAISLQHRRLLIDFRCDGLVRWRAMQSGNRKMCLVVALADGTWLISEQGDNRAGPWHEFEIRLVEASWHRLDIDLVERRGPARNVDLSRVSAVGVSDLQAGGGPNHCSRLDWMEVLGRTVPRNGVPGGA